MTDSGICEVIVTGPTGDLLPTLGRALVEARLAASVNVFAALVESTYWWRDSVQNTTETRLHLLTRVDLVDDLVAYIRQHHPYEVPNVTAIPVIGGNPDFIRWVKDETATVQKSRGAARTPGSMPPP